MKINNVDISIYGGKQHRKSLETCEIKNMNEWDNGMINPIILPARTGLKIANVEIMVYGTSREEIRGKANTIAALMLEKCIVEFDGANTYFEGSLESASIQGISDISREWQQKLIVKLKGYEYGKEYSANMTLTKKSGVEFKIKCSNTIITPVILEISTNRSAVNLALAGFCHDKYGYYGERILINYSFTREKLVIDGETGNVYQKDTNGYTENGSHCVKRMNELPTVLPIENVCYYENTGNYDINLKVTFKPRIL